MGFHFPRITTIVCCLLLLDHAAAMSQILSPSTYNPTTYVWTVTNGRYISSQSGDATYLDFVFNNNGEEYVTLSVDAYGYTGNPDSPAPASYNIEVNGQHFTYDASQARPVVFNNLVPTDNYRILISAPSSATGVIINSVVASRPDAPASPTSTHPTTSSLPPSPVVVGSTIQASSLAESSVLSSFSLSTSAGTIIGSAASTVRQSLGVPIFVTISGSAVPESSQTSTLLSSGSSGGSSPPIGAIIGTIGGVLIAMILAALIYFRRRDRSRQKREQDVIDSYLIEENAQKPPNNDLHTMEWSSMVAEKSLSSFPFSDRRDGRTPRRQTAMVSSATPHISYTTTIMESSLTSREYGEMEGPNSEDFTSNSRISRSGAGGQTIAPPAYVEQESNSARINDLP